MSDYIVKNTTLLDKQWGGIDIAASGQYTLEQVDLLRFISDSTFVTDLNTGDAVVNNGDDDLSAALGLLHLKKQLVFIHEDVDIYPAVGANAAEAYKISNAAAGFRFEIGDEMFSQGRLDDIIGDGVEFESHWSIDNNVADRWVAFEINLITTTGGGDKIMTTPDVTFTAGPFLVPTTVHQMFRFGGVLPIEYFANGEKYIYMGVKRIDVTGLGKTNPTNDPILYRVCKVYARRLDE